MEKHHLLKIELARAQLGTATDLFIRDRDPISVHALSCGACELLDGVGHVGAYPVLSSLLLDHQPELDIRKIKRVRNKHWNAFKHFFENDNKTVRDDSAALETFSDIENDTMLFQGWYDYQALTGRLPIEAQVMQIWYLAVNESRLQLDFDNIGARRLFADIQTDERVEQKRRLRRACERYRHDKVILEDPKTEARLTGRAPIVS